MPSEAARALLLKAYEDLQQQETGLPGHLRDLVPEWKFEPTYSAIAQRFGETT